MNHIDDCRLITLARNENVLNWRLLEYGLRQQFVGPAAIVDEALRAGGECDDLPAGLIRLLSVSTSDEEQVTDALRELANESPVQSDEHLSNVWRYLLLRDLRTSESDLDKVLLKVAALYRQFDYPADMRDAVYYMPPEGGESAKVGAKLRSPIEALDSLLGALKAKIAVA